MVVEIRFFVILNRVGVQEYNCIFSRPVTSTLGDWAIQHDYRESPETTNNILTELFELNEDRLLVLPARRDEG